MSSFSFVSTNALASNLLAVASTPKKKCFIVSPYQKVGWESSVPERVCRESSLCRRGVLRCGVRRLSVRHVHLLEGVANAPKLRIDPNLPPQNERSSEKKARTTEFQSPSWSNDLLNFPVHGEIHLHISHHLGGSADQCISSVSTPVTPHPGSKQSRFSHLEMCQVLRPLGGASRSS